MSVKYLWWCIYQKTTHGIWVRAIPVNPHILHSIYRISKLNLLLKSLSQIDVHQPSCYFWMLKTAWLYWCGAAVCLIKSIRNNHYGYTCIVTLFYVKNIYQEYLSMFKITTIVFIICQHSYTLLLSIRKLNQVKSFSPLRVGTYSHIAFYWLINLDMYFQDIFVD